LLRAINYLLTYNKQQSRATDLVVGLDDTLAFVVPPLFLQFLEIFLFQQLKHNHIDAAPATAHFSIRTEWVIHTMTRCIQFDSVALFQAAMVI